MHPLDLFGRDSRTRCAFAARLQRNPTGSPAAVHVVLRLGRSDATRLAGFALQRPGLRRDPASAEDKGSIVPDWTTVPYEPFDLVPAVPDNPVLVASDVTDGYAALVADPFIFHEDDTWYMFFEAYMYNPPAGRICLATSSDGLAWTYDRVVLDDGTHHSFPCVFKYDGSYYMVPESSAQDRIPLYRAANFPYDWEYVATLVSRQDIVDPSSVPVRRKMVDVRRTQRKRQLLPVLFRLTHDGMAASSDESDRPG